MRADRGFFCLPEVDIGIPFTVGMDALIRAKLPAAAAAEAMTTARRYGGHDAVEAGIVGTAVEADAVVPAALDIARPLAAKAGPTLGTIKERMYAEVVARLAQTEGATLGQ
jgi:enoyl-CoA hydratase/carnithine racemase